MNLFNAIKEVLDGGLADVLIAQNDLPKEKAKSALNGLTLSTVMALMKRGSNDSGLKQLYNLTQQKGADSKTPQPGDSAATVAEFILKGDKLVQTITPGAKSAVAMHVSRIAGVPNSVVGQFMGAVMLVAIDLLRKQAQTQETDSTGLANLLAAQSDYVSEAAPQFTDKVIEALGMQGFAMAAVEPPAPANATTTTKPAVPARQPFINHTDNDERPAVNWLKWGGIALATVAAAAVGYYFFQKPSTEQFGDEEIAVEVPTDTASAPKPTPKPAAVLVNPVFVELDNYLANSTAKPNRSFSYPKINFADNTVELTPAGDSLVRNLTTLLQKYPNAQIKFVAFANDAKLPTTNQQLSSKRAYALKDMVAKAGIDMMRLDAQGKGSGLNPRDTLRKQLPLRVILVKIVKK